VGKDRQRKEKQIEEQIQRGSEMYRKPQSRTKGERPDKGTRKKYMIRHRVGARRMGSHRTR
jgi:hypothetical protein